MCVCVLRILAENSTIRKKKEQLRPVRAETFLSSSAWYCLRIISNLKHWSPLLNVCRQ